MINQEITTKDFEATRHHFETEIPAQWWGINGHEFWNWDYMDEKFPNGLEARTMWGVEQFGFKNTEDAYELVQNEVQKRMAEEFDMTSEELEELQIELGC